MKKTLLVVFAGAVLFAPLALFAAGQEEGTATETKVETADPYAPIEGKRYHIAWVGYQTAPIAENPVMISHWNERFNVDIEVLNIDRNKWFEILDLKLAAGEVPDNIWCKWLDAYRRYINMGVLAVVPMEAVIKYAPDVYRLMNKEGPEAFGYATVDGKMYGVPRGFNFNAIYRRALAWRGDWLENVGVAKVPDTLAEYEDAFYKFVKDDPDGNGKDDTYALSFSGLECVFGAFGYMNEKWQKRDGRLVYGSIQPEVKEALALMHKWYKDKVLDPEYMNGENTTSEQWMISDSFFTGRIGFTGHGSYNHWYAGGSYEGDVPGPTITALKEANPAAFESLVFSMPPLGPEGKRGMYLNTAFEGHVTAYGAHLEKERDKIGKMLQVGNDMCAKDYETYVSVNYGIKGQHWDFDENGNVVSFGDWSNGKVRSSNGGHSLLLNFKFMTYDKMLKRAQTEWAEKNNMDIGGIKNELVVSLPSDPDYKEDLLEMEREVFGQIITGERPIDYFDEFVTTWRRAGGAVLEQEANDWYRSTGL